MSELLSGEKIIFPLRPHVVQSPDIISPCGRDWQFELKSHLFVHNFLIADGCVMPYSQNLSLYHVHCCLVEKIKFKPPHIHIMGQA